MAPMIFIAALAGQVSATPAAPPKPLLICRASQQETGTHIHTGRRCKTAEEWAREDAEKTRMSPSAQVTEGQGDSLTRSPPH